ncbi:MAG: hypothetical protein WCC45_01860 [Paeniglutamicibacter sp.]
MVSSDFRDFPANANERDANYIGLLHRKAASAKFTKVTLPTIPAEPRSAWQQTRKDPDQVSLVRVFLSWRGQDLNL